MSPLTICLIIFALMVIGFCSGKYSLATISLVSMMALVLTGCMDAKDALTYFSNNNVIMIAGMCSATSFLRNWDSILEKKRANLRSISEPARLRQPPPQKHGSGTRKRAGSKHTGGATNSRPSRAFCPLVG